MNTIYVIWGAILGVFIYRFIQNFKTTNTGNMFNFIFLVVGLLAGVGVMFFINKNFGKKPDVVKENSQVILQKIERVFKVITAEGSFSEVFDYSQTTHIASFIPSTKKALILVNAKVLMGYDFKKLKLEIDADNNKIKIVDFPKPEILSMEPDIKYYSMENGLFNKFDGDDLSALQTEAKQKILNKVEASELPQIAQRQMQQMLLELSDMKHWQLTGEEKIGLPDSNIKLLN